MTSDLHRAISQAANYRYTQRHIFQLCCYDGFTSVMTWVGPRFYDEPTEMNHVWASAKKDDAVHTHTHNGYIRFNRNLLNTFYRGPKNRSFQCE